MAQLHPTAIVSPTAQLHETVQVGAFTIIGDNVRVAANTSIGSHCVIEGHTQIDCDNQIASHNSIGSAAQDKKYRNEATRLVIGARNTIREFCTINTGTIQGGGVTTIGDDNWIMAYVHIAHDCQVGSHTIMANTSTLAGHVEVGDWAIIGGLTGVHQFTKIGAHAMVGFASAVSQDIAPYMMVDGNPLSVRGINSEGLRRRGFGNERIAFIKHLHKLLFRSGFTLEQAQAAIAQASLELVQKGSSAKAVELMQQDAELLLNFILQSSRGIAR